MGAREELLEQMEEGREQLGKEQISNMEKMQVMKKTPGWGIMDSFILQLMHKGGQLLRQKKEMNDISYAQGYMDATEAIYNYPDNIISHGTETQKELRGVNK